MKNKFLDGFFIIGFSFLVGINFLLFLLYIELESIALTIVYLLLAVYILYNQNNQTTTK